MNYHAKRKLIQHSTYIVLALIICSISCLSIVAVVSAKRTKDHKIDPPVPETLPSETPDNDQAQTPSNKPNDPIEPDQSTSSEEEASYVLPADGYVQKNFTIDLPVWSLTMEDYRTHAGIDVSAACGSAVYAMTEGVITSIQEDPLMGMSVTVMHADGNVALYQNLATELPSGIKEGVSVTAGQVIASVGDTSLIECCETDHLHLELFSPTGEHINPETLLDFSQVPETDKGGQ